MGKVNTVALHSRRLIHDLTFACVRGGGVFVVYPSTASLTGWVMLSIVQEGVVGA